MKGGSAGLQEVSAGALYRLVAWGRAVDTRFFEAGYRRHSTPARDRILMVLTRSGDGPLHAALALLVMLLAPIQGPQFFKTAVLAFLVERSLYYLLKQSFRRSRPCQKLGFVGAGLEPADQFSFPSGHTSAAVLLAVLLGGFFPVTLLLTMPWALMVGYSRVYLGLHFPLDILAGGLLGAMHGWAALGWIQ